MHKEYKNSELWKKVNKIPMVSLIYFTCSSIYKAIQKSADDVKIAF